MVRINMTKCKVAIQYGKSSFRWLSIPKYSKMVLIHNFHYLEILNISTEVKPKAYPIIMLCAENKTRYYHNPLWIINNLCEDWKNYDATMEMVRNEFYTLTDKSIW